MSLRSSFYFLLVPDVFLRSCKHCVVVVIMQGLDVSLSLEPHRMSDVPMAWSYAVQRLLGGNFRMDVSHKNAKQNHKSSLASKELGLKNYVLSAPLSLVLETCEKPWAQPLSCSKNAVVCFAYLGGCVSEFLFFFVPQCHDSG